MSAGRDALLDALRSKKLIVCVGSGGVGKTTTAAALAIQAALLGRRVVVVTIDPARRLANSLGLSALGNEERPIDLQALLPPGVQARGTLHAMMLDTRRTFDELIRRVAPDEATRERVFRNVIYRHISDTLSASHDYMASEKLHDLDVSGRYDLIVLDTPPMKNAIDFIEAGGRLSRFLDEKIVGWFLKPHGTGRAMGSQLLSGTSTVVYRLLGNVFGSEFLDEIADFFLAFRDMLAGFRQRAQAIEALLADARRTRFVIVCTPRPASMEEARWFHQSLRERRLPGDLFIVNQVGRFPGRRVPLDGSWPGAATAQWFVAAAGGAEGSARELLSGVTRHFARMVAQADADAAAITALQREVGRTVNVVCCARRSEEVADMAALLDVGRTLLAD